MQKTLENTRKMLDLRARVWYSINYLSEERFLFARNFQRRRETRLPYREANVRTEKSG